MANCPGGCKKPDRTQDHRTRLGGREIIASAIGRKDQSEESSETLGLENVSQNSKNRYEEPADQESSQSVYHYCVWPARALAGGSSERKPHQHRGGDSQHDAGGDPADDPLRLWKFEAARDCPVGSHQHDHDHDGSSVQAIDYRA
jgi:hypothetical protein